MLKTLSLAAAVAAMSITSVHAAPVTFEAVLSGPAEAPPNASPGTGFAKVVYDSVLHTMQIDVIFSGLVGTSTVAHIHCCTAFADTGTAGVATTTPTFAGFPAGVTAGIYSNLLDLTLASSWNPAFVTAHTDIAGAEAFFGTGLAAGKAYFNLHSTSFPGGEIRGFLVPEPSSLALMALSIVALGAASVRRRRPAQVQTAVPG